MLEWLDANLVSVLNGLAIAALLFMIAAGLSLIFGLLDVLNLAHGAVFLLGGYLAMQVSPGSAFHVVSVPVVLLAGLVAGVVLASVVHPITSRGYLDQALLTLGAAFVLGDVAVMVWGREPQSIAAFTPFQGSVTVLGSTYPVYRLVVMLLGALVAAALYLGIERTRLGAMVRASVADAEMVGALGINVRRLRVGVFALGSMLAMLGGMLATPILGMAPGMDFQFLMLALIVVVIGGLGSLKGAMVAALLIGQVRSVGVALAPELAPFLLFGTMALVLAVRPTGLFGRALT